MLEYSVWLKTTKSEELYRTKEVPSLTRLLSSMTVSIVLYNLAHGLAGRCLSPMSVLGTSPVQHREVQKQESDLFQSYFKHIIYFTGGVASGFHHHQDQQPITRLLQIHKPQALSSTRSHNAVIISEVPLHFDSLNNGDVFVLDTGDKIYQWQGQKSQGVEKAKAAEFIAQLISERDGKGETVIVGK